MGIIGTIKSAISKAASTEQVYSTQDVLNDQATLSRFDFGTQEVPSEIDNAVKRLAAHHNASEESLKEVLGKKHETGEVLSEVDWYTHPGDPNTLRWNSEDGRRSATLTEDAGKWHLAIHESSTPWVTHEADFEGSSEQAQRLAANDIVEIERSSLVQQQLDTEAVEKLKDWKNNDRVDAYGMSGVVVDKAGPNLVVKFDGSQTPVNVHGVHAVPSEPQFVEREEVECGADKKRNKGIGI